MKKIYLKVIVLLLCGTTYAQTTTTVNSLTELLPYLKESDVNVKLAAGDYTVTGDDVSSGDIGEFWSGSEHLGNTFNVFLFEGSNSAYDFDGVTIYIKTETAQSVGNVDFYELRIIGNNNTISNLTVVDDGSEHDAPTNRATNVVLDGANNILDGCHFTVKGSYPYGYGDIFGKGGGPVISHNKRSACLIRGKSNLVKDCTFICRNYGHGIFFQGAEDPMVDGCYVEGELRSTDEVLAEEGTGSAADNVDFQTVFGFDLRDITGNYYFSLQEAGVRSYNAGETIIDGVEYDRGVTGATVLNTTIVKMRVGVNIGWASGDKYVENCTALACESGYWVGSDTEVVDSRGDASIGALLTEDASRSNATVELTLLDNYVTPLDGEVTSFYYAGTGHYVTLYDETTSVLDNIIVSIGGERLGHRWMTGNESTNEPLNFDASNITINNFTEYPLVMGSNSSGTTGQSCGAITDEGISNEVDLVDCATACVYEQSIDIPVHAISGVNYDFYEGSYDELPDFTTLDVVAFGIVDNLNITATDSLDQFAVVFDGTLEVGTDDRYTFYVSSDDPTSLVIDGEEVINYDGASGMIESSGVICLEEGYHTIEIVRVEKNTDQTFTLSYESADITKTTELDIYGIDFSTITNLAYLSTTVTQSSTTNSGEASLAVDGNTDGLFAGGSVTHTASDEIPWWQLDLEETHLIGEIHVFNRSDACCSGRLGQFMVTVIDEKGVTRFSQVVESITESSIILDAGGVQGKVIRVEKTEVGVLSLAEVEVYEGEMSSSVGPYQIAHSSIEFGLDGGSFDAVANFSVKLYDLSNHENLTWTEIEREKDYYSYQKYDTDLCLDGGDSDERATDLTVETCDENSASQQWFKIGSGDVNYRLQRKDSELYIDASWANFNGANIYLDTLRPLHMGQQWRFDLANLDSLAEDAVLDTKQDFVNSNVIIYPNPAKESITINIDGGSFSEYKIFNIQGSLVYQNSIPSESSKMSIDISNFPKGLYLVKLYGDQNLHLLKIIKQ